MDKSDFQKFYAKRKKMQKRGESNYGDTEEIIESMVGYYYDTLDFIKDATREEIALAFEGLVAFVKEYPEREIVQIFKQKMIQYRELSKYCRIDMQAAIKAAEEIVQEEKNRIVPFEEEFSALFQSWKQQLSDLPYSDWMDGHKLVKLFLRDFEETKRALQNATVEEIGFSIYVLEDMVRVLSKGQAEELVWLFKEKAREFPAVQDYSDCDYAEEIERAESYLEDIS